MICPSCDAIALDERFPITEQCKYCAHCEKILLRKRIAANPLAGLVTFREEGMLRIPTLTTEPFSFIPWVQPSYKEFARSTISQTPAIKWRHLRQELGLSASMTELCIDAAQRGLSAGFTLGHMECSHCQGILLDNHTFLETQHSRDCL